MATWNPAHETNQEEDALHANWVNADAGNVRNSGYARSLPATHPAQTSRAKRNVCIFLVLLVVVIVVICAIAIPIAVKNKKNDETDSRSGDGNDGESAPMNSLKIACSSTLYPEVCYSSLSGFVSNSSSTKPQDLVKYAIEAASNAVEEELSDIKKLISNNTAFDNSTIQAAAQDCVSFLEDSADSLNDTLGGIENFRILDASAELADLRTWVSAALTNQVSCSDGFDDLDLGTSDSRWGPFLKEGNYTAMLLSNVLALLKALTDVTSGLPNLPGGNRRLLSDDPFTIAVQFNEIVAPMTRRLLQTSNLVPNVTVTLDGSGNYKSIQEAVDKAPVLSSKSSAQYVILIRTGKYYENVNVPKYASNIVFIGDGMGKTIISGSLSVIGSNVTTSLTGTLTVQGKNFVGLGFTVENTAGAVNRQAVAMRVTGDLSAFQNCEFLGFQDTLYTHTNRQFYTNCRVVGTVDYIFGNAAAVFQNCELIATTGLLGQQNTYTASGRTDPNQNTGIIFQACSFSGTSSLNDAVNNGTFLTYLGRPWKYYARTVVMRSTESAVVNSDGWLLWNGDATHLSTVYYGEYQNSGPGFQPSKRVYWSKQISVKDAQTFTANSFVQASTWLPKRNFSYAASV